MKKGSSRLRFDPFFISIRAGRSGIRTAEASLGVVGEFDNSGTEIQKASLVTPSWTNSLREFGPERSEGLPAVAGNNLSGRANFTYRDNVLARFTSPTRRRNQVVAGELWDSPSQTFSAAAIRLVSSAEE